MEPSPEERALIIHWTETGMRTLDNLPRAIDMNMGMAGNLWPHTYFITGPGAAVEAIGVFQQAITDYKEDYEKCLPVCVAFRNILVTKGLDVLGNLSFVRAVLSWLDFPLQAELFLVHCLEPMLEAIKERADLTKTRKRRLLGFWHHFMQSVLPARAGRVDDSAFQLT